VTSPLRDYRDHRRQMAPAMILYDRARDFTRSAFLILLDTASRTGATPPGSPWRYLGPAAAGRRAARHRNLFSTCTRAKSDSGRGIAGGVAILRCCGAHWVSSFETLDPGAECARVIVVPRHYESFSKGVPDSRTSSLPVCILVGLFFDKARLHGSVRCGGRGPN